MAFGSTEEFHKRYYSSLGPACGLKYSLSSERSLLFQPHSSEFPWEGMGVDSKCAV